MKAPKILFFIHGPVASKEEKEQANQYPFPVHFRNADHIGEFFTPEACDGVDGDVPEQYRKFPQGMEAVKAFREDFSAVHADLTDVGIIGGAATIDPELAPKTTGTTGKPEFNTNRVEDEGKRVIDPNALTVTELTENVEKKPVDEKVEQLLETQNEVDSGKNPEVEKKASTKAATKEATGWKAGK